MRVALIACVKSKQPRPAPAGELYTSALFRSSVRYAQARADKWYILSAKHGLLAPDRVIAPYEETLRSKSSAERRKWAARVQQQLLEVIPRGAEVLMLAGLAYRQDLVSFLEQRGHLVITPLAGKRFGEQLQHLAAASGKSVEPSRDLDRFYATFKRLASLPGQGAALGTCTGRMPWPQRGVYFFVEPGEVRKRGDEQRIVRVGTHAVSAGASSTLWQRLRAHRGGSGGGGNHRGSVFRRHIGKALLSREGDGSGASWGVGSNAEKAVRVREATLEDRVSAYLAATRVYWLEVPDAAGRESMRSYIERNSIALLSNGQKPLDPPSPSWLGRSSDHERIRQSGLWNLDHVDGCYEPGFLGVFEDLVQRMTAKVNPPIQAKPLTS